MANKESMSKSTERSKRLVHRGIKEGDKKVNRHKSHKPIDKIKPNEDLLTAIQRKKPQPVRATKVSATSPQPILSLDDIKKSFIERFAKAVIVRANRENWTPESRRAAVDVIKHFVYGGGSLDTIVEPLTKKQLDNIVWDFANVVWFKHNLLGNIALPGMQHPLYAKKRQSVVKRFTSRKLVATATS